MRGAFWLTLLLALLTVPPYVRAAAGGDLVAMIARQSAEYPVVRARFTQTRTMSALKKPLITRGTLIYSRRDGVLWRIEAPYAVTYVLGESRVAEIGADGTRRERDAREIPGLAQVAKVFRALLGSDVAVLHNLFDAKASGGPDRWEIALTPHVPEVKRHLNGMRLTGGRFVEMVQVDEAGGDVTRLNLHDTRGDQGLTPEEFALFAPGR